MVPSHEIACAVQKTSVLPSRGACGEGNGRAGVAPFGAAPFAVMWGGCIGIISGALHYMMFSTGLSKYPLVAAKTLNL